MRVVLEHVGDQMHIAACDSVIGGGTHQGDSDQASIAKRRLDRKATDLGDPVATEKFLHLQPWVQQL